MWPAILVGLGGFLGSIGRYLLGKASARWLGQSLLPVGTMAANLLGCFLIGMLMSSSRVRDDESLRPLLVTGLLGGFTTFSSFSRESLDLLRAGHTAQAFVNIGLSVALGLAAAAAGHALVSR